VTRRGEQPRQRGRVEERRVLQVADDPRLSTLDELVDERLELQVAGRVELARDADDVRRRPGVFVGERKNAMGEGASRACNLTDRVAECGI
jgi:hypothetical protein